MHRQDCITVVQIVNLKIIFMIIWIIGSSVAPIWMFVFPQNSCWRFNTQCDGIRQWDLGRVLRLWGWRLMGSMGLRSYKWDPVGFHSPFLHERTQAAYIIEEAPQPTMLAVWSRVSSFQTCEKYIPVVYKLIIAGSVVKNPPAMWEMQETWVWSLGWEEPLEEEMATPSSSLAWKIPWERNLVCYCPWVQRTGHDWAHTGKITNLWNIVSLCPDRLGQLFVNLLVVIKGYKALICKIIKFWRLL